MRPPSRFFNRLQPPPPPPPAVWQVGTLRFTQADLDAGRALNAAILKRMAADEAAGLSPPWVRRTRRKM